MDTNKIRAIIEYLHEEGQITKKINIDMEKHFGRGCMLCRMTVTVDNFSQLKEGDQICLPGRAPVLGMLYDHHAVVAKIEDKSDDGQTAKLTVFDVDEKGKTGICSCTPLRIKRHVLYGKNKHHLSTRSFKLHCQKEFREDSEVNVTIRKVNYRLRKFKTSKIVKRAERSLEQLNEKKYCICLQNCEHFACALVNGPDDENNLLKESISIQAHGCLWLFFSVIFWAVQATFYGFNFWMYAVFVKNDSDFEFLSKDHGLKDFLNRTCNAGESSPRFFQTTCDWTLIGIFLAIFSLLFLIIVLSFYLPLYMKKYICKQCFVTTLINLFFSRLVSFAMVEIVHILTERPLYQLVTGWKMTRFETILMLVVVCMFGALLIYTLASVITKMIVWCCGLCFDSMNGYNQYVPWKGFMWCFCKLMCCCKKKTNQSEEEKPLMLEIM